MLGAGRGGGASPADGSDVSPGVPGLACSRCGHSYGEEAMIDGVCTDCFLKNHDDAGGRREGEDLLSPASSGCERKVRIPARGATSRSKSMRGLENGTAPTASYTPECEGPAAAGGGDATPQLHPQRSRGIASAVQVKLEEGVAGMGDDCALAARSRVDTPWQHSHTPTQRGQLVASSSARAELTDADAGRGKPDRARREHSPVSTGPTQLDAAAGGEATPELHTQRSRGIASAVQVKLAEGVAGMGDDCALAERSRVDTSWLESLSHTPTQRGQLVASSSARAELADADAGRGEPDRARREHSPVSTGPTQLDSEVVVGEAFEAMAAHRLGEYLQANEAEQHGSMRECLRNARHAAKGEGDRLLAAINADPDPAWAFSAEVAAVKMAALRKFGLQALDGSTPDDLRDQVFEEATENTYDADSISRAFELKKWEEGGGDLSDHLQEFFYKFFIALAEGEYTSDDVVALQKTFDLSVAADKWMAGACSRLSKCNGLEPQGHSIHAVVQGKSKHLSMGQTERCRWKRPRAPRAHGLSLVIAVAFFDWQPRDGQGQCYSC